MPGEASHHKLAYVVESTRGTTPATPRFRYLPDSKTTLALSKDTLTSERLTGDRFPAEPRTGASSVTGDIPIELSSQAYDPFIESALQGAFVDDAGVGIDSIDITVDGTPSLGAEVLDQWTTTNGVVTLEYVDSKREEVVLTYDTTVPSGIVTYELFGLDNVTIDSEVFQITAYTDALQSATVKAGDTRKSFSILREFSDFDGGEPFLLFTGCEVSTWSISAAANGLATSTFSFFGRDMVGPSAAAPTDTSYAPAIDTEPFDTFSGSMEIDGVAECIVTDYNLTINNGHAPKYAVGCAASQDPMVTQSLIEGSITVYFEDAVIYSKFVDESSMTLKLTLTDSNLDKLVIWLPNLKIGSGTQPDVTGDGAITIPVNFTAHKDNTLLSHISVQSIRPV